MSPSGTLRSWRVGGSHRKVRHRFAVAGFAIVAALCGACGITPHRGVELGSLRENARRVEGGGVECPLTIGNRLLRPATVADDAPVLPHRTDGDSAQGTIGSRLPSDDSVEITCSYAIDGLRVDLVVVGVPRGHASSVMFDRLASASDKATALTFIAANADVPVGAARSLPGDDPGAFVRVTAAEGDVAMSLRVGRLDEDATLPTSQDVTTQARRLARALAD